jgi:hypothetical protein
VRELVDTRDVLGVTYGVRQELKRRRWSRKWPPLPQQALIGERWPGSRDVDCNPSSPCRRCRFTHFDAVAREIPISAATCAIGRVLQRSIHRRRPSTDNGAFAWVMV